MRRIRWDPRVYRGWAVSMGSQTHSQNLVLCLSCEKCDLDSRCASFSVEKRCFHVYMTTCKGSQSSRDSVLCLWAKPRVAKTPGGRYLWALVWTPCCVCKRGWWYLVILHVTWEEEIKKQERGRRERRLGVEIWVLWGMARISLFKSALKILKIHFAISAFFSNCKLLNQWLQIDRESSIQLKKRRITLTVLFTVLFTVFFTVFFTVYFDGLRSLDICPTEPLLSPPKHKIHYARFFACL